MQTAKRSNNYFKVRTRGIYGPTYLERGHDELYFFDESDLTSIRHAYEAARAFACLVRHVATISVFRRTGDVASMAPEVRVVGENYVATMIAA